MGQRDSAPDAGRRPAAVYCERVTGTRTRSTAQRRSWDERALLPDRVGIPWWAAAFCALGLAAIGAFADMERLNRLGMVFEVCYFLGCLLAVVVVQRKGLFGPMVQPPLILAVTVPGVILAIGSYPTGGSMLASALADGSEAGIRYQLMTRIS